MMGVQTETCGALDYQNFPNSVKEAYPSYNWNRNEISLQTESKLENKIDTSIFIKITI